MSCQEKQENTESKTKIRKKVEKPPVKNLKSAAEIREEK